MKTIASKLLSLGKSDLIKGLLMAFIGVVLKAVQTGIDTNSFPSTWSQWSTILLMGGKVAVAYFIKNVFTNSEGKFLTSEPVPVYPLTK